MWFLLLIIGMVASYVSARRWGYQLYQYYRPRIALAFRTRKLPVSETDEDVAKKKFDLESVIMPNCVSCELETSTSRSVSASGCDFCILQGEFFFFKTMHLGNSFSENAQKWILPKPVYCVCVIETYIRTAPLNFYSL